MEVNGDDTAIIIFSARGYVLPERDFVAPQNYNARVEYIDPGRLFEVCGNAARARARHATNTYIYNLYIYIT